MTIVSIDARMIRSSGIGTIITSIVPRLLAWRPQWEFRMLGDPNVLKSYDWAGAAHARIVPFVAPLYSVAEQSRWPSAAVRCSDLVWSPNYNIPLRWRGRLIVNVNDVAHLALPEAYGGLMKRFYARTMFERVRRRADGILYISSFSGEEFNRLVGKPVKAREFMIHCGVEEIWYSIEAGAPLRQKPFILFVGNVKPHKNLSRLLDAFRQVMKRIPHDLLIVGRKEGFLTGDGGVQERLTQFGERVAFTGFVPDADLRRFFAQADALVLPSLYEGFGLPPLEAMAAGCPVLVSRVASLPEVCLDAALYCDPLSIDSIADGLARIATDAALRAKLREKGRARALSLTWDTSAKRYLDAFEATMTARASSGS